MKHQTLRSKTTMLFGYGSKHRYSKNWMVNTVNSLDGQHLWVLQILILVQSRCFFPNPAIHVFLGQFLFWFLESLFLWVNPKFLNDIIDSTPFCEKKSTMMKTPSDSQSKAARHPHFLWVNPHFRWLIPLIEQLFPRIYLLLSSVLNRRRVEPMPGAMAGLNHFLGLN